MSLEAKRLELAELLAYSCRILAREGHGDLDLGHVSARIGDDQVLMKASGLGLEEARPDNLVTINLKGQKLRGDHPVHVEYPIHTEIYRARPDVRSVIHTHPPYATVLGSSGQSLQPVSHDALAFTGNIGLFDATPELVTTEELGRQVAAALGDKRGLFIKNHGVVVVGRTVQDACVRAVLLEKAARMQCIAGGFGGAEPISPEVAEKMYREKWSDYHLGHIWNYLVRTVDAGR